jgi:hypothetical protein
MSAIKSKQPVRIGFDMDGVLLYNPTRTVRPLIHLLKKIFLKNYQFKFYVPKTPLEIFIWELAHKSSLFIAPGFSQVEKLVKEEKIEAYVVTARFEHLAHDTQRWFNKLNRKGTFKQLIYNQHNEQPHLYKEKIIKELDLDIFIEDNWDIVKHLVKSRKERTHVYWISNFLDRRIKYPHKHSNFASAVKEIKRRLI